jgi:hypothetical protein
MARQTIFRALEPQDDDATDDFEFVVPSNIRRWTLAITPTHTDDEVTPGALTFELEYWDGKDSYRPTNPVTSGTLSLNSANIITREDVIDKFRCRITNEAPRVDGEYRLNLMFW